MIVSSVPKEYVGIVWRDVEPMLSKALDVHGSFTVDDVLNNIANGTVALWVMMDEDTDEIVAAATTRFQTYPRGMALAIDWIGGTRMSEWLGELDAMMERYARDHNCTHIEGFGRDGWVKALAPYGYQKWYPTYKKELA